MEEEKINNMIDDINEHAKNGEIICMTIDGPQVAKIEEIIKQPLEGLLYDLNRNKATIYTNAKNSKSLRWVNDLAMIEVLSYLYNENKLLKEELENSIKPDKKEAEVPKKEPAKTMKDFNKQGKPAPGVKSGFDDTVVFRI